MSNVQPAQGVSVETASEPVASAARKARPETIHAFDILRVLGSFGIVWFHTDGARFRAVGYAGLPVFLFISFILLSLKPEPDALGVYAGRRAKRLLVPWLFWSVLYGVLFYLRPPTGEPSLARLLSISELLKGYSYHLWYLPFTFVASMVLWVGLRATRSLTPIPSIVLGVLCGVPFLVLQPAMAAVIGDQEPWSQWGFSLASIPLGFALGRSRLLPCPQPQRTAIVVITTMTVAGALAALAQGDAFTGVSYSLGALLVGGSLLVPVRRNEYIAGMAELTLGIFVLGPFVATVAAKVLGGFPSPYVEIVVEFVGAALLTAGLRRLPYGKTVL